MVSGEYCIKYHTKRTVINVMAKSLQVALKNGIFMHMESAIGVANLYMYVCMCVCACRNMTVN